MYSQVLYSYRADDMAPINEEIGVTQQRMLVCLESCIMWSERKFGYLLVLKSKSPDDRGNSKSVQVGLDFVQPVLFSTHGWSHGQLTLSGFLSVIFFFDLIPPLLLLTSFFHPSSFHSHSHPSLYLLLSLPCWLHCCCKRLLICSLFYSAYIPIDGLNN